MLVCHFDEACYRAQNYICPISFFLFQFYLFFVCFFIISSHGLVLVLFFEVNWKSDKYFFGDFNDYDWIWRLEETSWTRKRRSFLLLFFFFNFVWMIRMRWICRRRPPTSCWRTGARRGFSCPATPVHLLRPAWAPCGRSKGPTTTNRLFTRRSWRTLPAISFPSITATSATKAKVIVCFFRSLFSHSFSSPCTLSALPLHGASGRNGRAINNVKFPHIPQSNGRVFSFFLTRNVKGDKIIWGKTHKKTDDVGGQLKFLR